MRGTSNIAIGEVAGTRREITVRNVVFGNCGSPGGLAPSDEMRIFTARPL